MTRRRLAALAVAGALATAGAITLTATSGHESDRALSATLGALVGVLFLLSGGVGWLRRPANRFGPLLVAVGFAWLAGSLTEANDPGVFTVGALLGSLALGAFAHAVLAFPTGTLDSRLARLTAVVAYLDVTVVQLARMLVDPRAGFTSAQHLPRNVMLVWRDHPAAHALDVLQRTVGLGAALAILALLVVRWRGAAPPLRRVLRPVLLAAGATVAALAVELAVAPLSGGAARAIDWVSILAFASVPVAFLVGILRTRLARSEVGRLVVELGRAPEPARLRDALRRTLADPTLEVAYWLPATGIFVDADGRHVELPADGADRVATMVEHEGRRVAALLHDRSVRDDRTLLDAAVAAAALALENERLQAELRARVEDLREERDFMHAVYSTAPSLLLVLDPDGRIVQFNQACEQLSGYRFTEVRGKRFWDLFIDPAETEGIERALAEAATAPVPTENANHWITRGGERRLIVWRNAALRDERGRLEFIVSGGLDVTELRRQEAELRASRTRLVEAGDRERRRLERNLHDGAQQRLVALSLALRLARARLESDPGESARILEAAGEELAQALEELRELARGIHPAVLADRGLDAALQALASRSPVPVVLRDQVGARLPAPVEAAAYYVIAEALTNMAKHAHASAAEVTISRMNGRAVVEVSDDGVGGADLQAGSGLRGLVDRLAALDGTLAIESAAGAGTRVRAEIPCAS